MSKLEKILSYIVFGLFIISISSCRTVKKDWVKETFAEKQELKSLEQSLYNYQKQQETKIITSLSKDFAEKLKQYQASTKENTNETTDINIDIKAEEGKEKSATVGNTTLTSNGANISLKTTSNKSYSKETETKLLEYDKKLQEAFSEISYLKEQIASQQIIDKKQNSEIEQLKETKSKNTKSSSISFGMGLFLFFIIIAILVYLYVKKVIRF